MSTKRAGVDVRAEVEALGRMTVGQLRDRHREPAVFDRAQAILKWNGHGNGAQVRNKHGAPLRGLLACGPCGCGIAHSYTAPGTTRYRYYVCVKAQKHGWAACPTKSVPAGQIEQHVVDQVRRAAQDPAVLAATLRQVRDQHERATAELRTEQNAAERALARAQAAVRKAVAAGDLPAAADAERRVEVAQRDLAVAKERVAAATADSVTAAELAAALTAFVPAWEQLTPREQARAVRLLVERVAYDGGAGTVAVTFRPAGIKTLAAEHGHTSTTTEAA